MKKLIYIAFCAVLTYGSSGAQSKLPDYVKKFSEDHPAAKGTFYSIEEANKASKDVVFLNLESVGLNEIPRDLMNYKNLKKLDLGNNDIGNIPEWFSTLSNLESLSLYKNQLKIFPGLLLKMKKLKIVDLGFNHIQEFEKLPLNTSIEEMDLNGNNIGEIPNDFEHFESLKTLNLDNNRIVYIPFTLFKMRRLEYLRLFRNNVRDFEIVNSVPSHLKTIYLAWNPISDQAVQRLRQAIPNCDVINTLR